MHRPGSDLSHHGTAPAVKLLYAVHLQELPPPPQFVAMDGRAVRLFPPVSSLRWMGELCGSSESPEHYVRVGGTQDGFDATACTSHGSRSRNTSGGIWPHPHGATMVGRIDMGWVRDSAYA